jgi:hypothetical protein
VVTFQRVALVLGLFRVDEETDSTQEEQTAEFTQSQDKSDIGYAIVVDVSDFDFGGDVHLDHFSTVSRVDSVNKSRCVYLQDLFNTG